MRSGTGRKLLVASLGVAAISYAACIETSGNLMAPPQPKDAGTEASSDGGRDGQAPNDGSPDQAP